MSTENPLKKRCLIKRLDFENCVVATIKSSSRGRRKKRLRARLTRDLKCGDRTPERDEKNMEMASSSSPVLLQRISLSTRQVPSPVLMRRHTERCSSPVFRCGTDTWPIHEKSRTYSVLFRSKRKINFDEEANVKLAELESSSQRSPVFKFKASKSVIKKELKDETSQRKVERKEQRVLAGTYINDGESGTSEDVSVQIEDFTQEYHDSNADISQVDSQNLDDSTVNIPGLKFLETPSSHSVTDHVNIRKAECHSSEKSHLELPRKNFKKNGLLHRLSVIRQKQTSEKRLWLHQNRLRTLSTSETLYVEDCWSMDVKQVLKCHSSNPLTKIKCLIVDGSCIPSLEKIEAGCQLRLTSPSERLCLDGEPQIQILLNVYRLELSYDKNSSSFEMPVAKFDKVCPDDVKDEDNSHVDFLYDSLLTSHVSPFLC
ncbi:hypothetical protein RUM44_001841 [Polyplax serrata]|uniref:Uncharacterized protein n=1 Tax=Polyplax serrata TaxID=468196 RepID=A0ABR1AL71_POLSC